MKTKIKRFLLFLGLSGLWICLFTNCSPSKTENPNTPTAVVDSSPVIEVLSKSNYNLAGKNFELQMLKIKKPERIRAVYAIYSKGCKEATCPLVAVANPYGGLDWSGEAIDLKWSQRTAGLHPDEDGPTHPLVTGNSQFAFFPQSQADSANMGGLFLYNELSMLVVHNRFFSGGTVTEYAEDFAIAVEAIKKLNEVSPTEIGYLGLSLGGFVVLNAARSQKPKIIAAVSPLLDLKMQVDTITSANLRITSNPTLLNNYTSFFNSYLRRIYNGFSQVGDYGPYRNPTIANGLPPTLLIQDTWDSSTPAESAENLVQLNPTAISPVWFKHATPLDWNTAVIDHQQPSEGMNAEVNSALFQSYLMKRLIPTKDYIVFAKFSEFKKGFQHFKSMSDRGDDISFLNPRLQDFCSDTALFFDTENIRPMSSLKLAINEIMTTVFSTASPCN